MVKSYLEILRITQQVIKKLFTDAEAHRLDPLLPKVEEYSSRRPAKIITALHEVGESKKVECAFEQLCPRDSFSFAGFIFSA